MCNPAARVNLIYYLSQKWRSSVRSSGMTYLIFAFKRTKPLHDHVPPASPAPALLALAAEVSAKPRGHADEVLTSAGAQKQELCWGFVSDFVWAWERIIGNKIKIVDSELLLKGLHVFPWGCLPPNLHIQKEKAAFYSFGKKVQLS